MSLSLPADQVAYEEDHAQATRLSGGKTSGPEWTTLSDRDGSIMGFYLAPNVINDFYDPQSGFHLSEGRSFLFIHARRAKGGEDRLVYVCANPIFSLRACTESGMNPSPPYFGAVLDWKVIKPGSLFTAPSNLASGSWRDATYWINMPKPVRIYAGQADPLDSSHFTFVFQTPKRKSTVDGWLQCNDQVIFQGQ